MKKILMFILMMISITSTCFAFEEPNSERWKKIGEDGKLAMWIDKQTLIINTEQSQQSEHCGHTYVTTWSIQHENSKQGHDLIKVEADLNCRTLDFRYAARYGEDGAVIESAEAPSRKPFSVLPGTVGEVMILAIEELKKSKESIWDNFNR